MERAILTVSEQVAPPPRRQRGGAGFFLDTAARCADLRGPAGLGDAAAERVTWDLPVTAEQVRALFTSMMAVRRLPADERIRALDTLTGLVNGTTVRPRLTVLDTARRPRSRFGGRRPWAPHLTWVSTTI